MSIAAVLLHRVALLTLYLLSFPSLSVQKGRMKEAQDVIMTLWSAGYAATDIIQTLFKVRAIYSMLYYTALSDV